MATWLLVIFTGVLAVGVVADLTLRAKEAKARRGHARRAEIEVEPEPAVGDRYPRLHVINVGGAEARDVAVKVDQFGGETEPLIRERDLPIPRIGPNGGRRVLVVHLYDTHELYRNVEIKWTDDEGDKKQDFTTVDFGA